MNNAARQSNDSTRSSVVRIKWRGGIGFLALDLAANIVLPAQDRQASPDAVKFKTLVNFDGTNGSSVENYALVQGFDGNLYGTAIGGGTNGNGTFFQMTPAGALTVLYNFTGCTQTDCVVYAPTGVTLGSDGDFYGAGTTYNGGAIFKISPTGALTVLQSFCSDPPNCTDGDFSYGPVVQGTDGNFYGVTVGGGTNTVGPCSFGLYGVGCGTVFKLTSKGAFSTIYNFCAQPNCADGAGPTAPLAPAGDGNLYGTNAGGGTYGNGTIFKITPKGKLTVVHSFNGSDGSPYGSWGTPMIQAANGNFYGTTQGGGATGNGTVFEITPAGAFTSLYSFCTQSNCPDGTFPLGIVQGTDGNLYGTTDLGGSNGYGTLFKLSLKGVLTTLHVFAGADGEYPTGLGQASNGVFYGTTDLGGADGDGVAFAVSAGLGPFVEAVPTSGKVGATIQVLGTNLTGATSVTFNGVAAAFTVVSATQITATVPTGATSGRVQVVTPTRTLKSNTRFVVRP